MRESFSFSVRRRRRPSRRRLLVAALAVVLLAAPPAPGDMASAGDAGTNSDPGILGTTVRGTGLLPNFAARASGLIRLQAGAFDPLSSRLPRPKGIPFVAEAGLAPAAPVYWIVQVRNHRFPEALAAARGAGALVAGYVHDDAYMVRATPLQRARIAAHPAIRWIGYYQPAWRVPVAAAGRPALLDVPGTQTYRVYVFRKDPAPGSVAKAIAAIPGARVVENAGVVIDVRATAAQVPAIASIPAVEWIGIKPEAVPLNANARWVIDTAVRDLYGATAAGRLTGAGQTAGVADTGINYTIDRNGLAHVAFRDCENGTCKEADYTQEDPGESDDALFGVTSNVDGEPHRKMAAYFDIGGTGPNPSDESSHGTHTAGTVTGDAGTPGAWDGHDGIAPGARLVHQNIGTPSGGLALPADSYQLWRQAYRPHDPDDVPYGDTVGDDLVNYDPLEDARTHNNSYGLVVPVIDDGSAVALDQFVWDHEDMAIVVSAGNSGPEPGTIGSPSVAKNDLSSAASSNGRQPMVSIDSITNFSSHGPTGDGRLGPDLATPGEVVISAKGGTEADYHVAQGTSMSGPVLAGAATLVRQYFYDGYGPRGGKGFPGGKSAPARRHNPSAALVKATLINGATRMRGYYTGDDGSDREMDGQYPSAGQGFGLVNLDNSLYFEDPTPDPLHAWYQDVYRADPNAFAPSATQDERTFRITVQEGRPLDVTLAWTDAPDLLPAGTPARVNNLDLVLTGPDGRVYVGNNFNTRQAPGAPEAETPPDAAAAPDLVNVTEKIRVATPAPGTYTITVRADPIAVGPQGFALAAAGSIAPVGTSFTPGPDRQVDAEGAPSITDVEAESVSADLTKITFRTSEPTTATATVRVGGADVTYADVYTTEANGYQGRPGGRAEPSPTYRGKKVLGTRHEIFVAGLTGGVRYDAVLRATDIGGLNAPEATASFTAPANVFQPLAPDIGQLVGGESPAQDWGVGKQLYAGTFAGNVDTNSLLGAFMFRLPSSVDPSAITGAAVELTTGHDWVDRYDADPLFTVDLLDESVEPAWGTQTYDEIKEARAVARMAPASAFHVGGGQRLAFTLSCSERDKLVATLQAGQDGERRAAFRFDATEAAEDAVFSAEFGYNRRSRGLDLRPKLILFTGDGEAVPPFVPCDPQTPAPTITEVGVHAGIATGTMTVSWRTDIDSDSLVLYREKGATDFVQVGSPARTRLHQVQVRNLDPMKSYEFGVRSTACNGASTTADNAGAGWNFFRPLGPRTLHGTFTFDEGDEGWTARTIDGNDLLPNTVWSREESGHDSPRAWYAMPYFDKNQAILTSPATTFGGTTASVSFFAAYDTEPTFDLLFVEYSTDEERWQIAGRFDGFNEEFPEFEQRTVTFPNPGGAVRIRFRFASDELISSPLYLGVAVDTVSFISYSPPQGPATLPLTGPASPQSAEASPPLDLAAVPTQLSPTEADVTAGTGLC